MHRLIAILLAGVLSGCSPASRSTTTMATPAPQGSASRSAGAAPSTVPADPRDHGPPPASGGAAAASDPVTSDDPFAPGELDEALSRLEQAELDGPGGLHILVRWHLLTGQTHVAAELAFTTAGGTLRFAEPPPESATRDSDEAPPDYPLMERILSAGPKRWVVLGWSSFGEGMQTQHAWLIEDHHGPQLLDSLAWTTDRSHGGFAVDPSANQVRIGVPLPQLPGADGEPSLHQGTGWVLVHGTQQLELEAVQRLPSSETHVMALRDYYDPPFQKEPSRLHWSGRFVWFSSGARFALETPPAITRPSGIRR